MIDSGILLTIGQQRQRELIAEAETRRWVKQIRQTQRRARRTPPGQLLRLLLTMAG